MIILIFKVISILTYARGMYWCLNLESTILIAERSFLVFLNDGLCQKQDWRCFIFGNIYKSWWRPRIFVGRGNALPLYRAQPAVIVQCKKVDLNLNLQVVQTMWLFSVCAKKKSLAYMKVFLFYLLFLFFKLRTHSMDLESMTKQSC